MGAADAGGGLVFQGAGLERREEPLDIADQEIAGLGELDGKAGVEHVGRGHALVDEARLRPDVLGQIGQEGDHVVLGFALDLVDSFDLEGAALPDRRCCLLRDHAEFSLRIAGMRLDLKPDPETVLGLPDPGHLGSAVARNHRRLASAVSGAGLRQWDIPLRRPEQCPPVGGARPRHNCVKRAPQTLDLG